MCKLNNMTITELIEMLQEVEHGASGRPRAITIYRRNNETGESDTILDEQEDLCISSTGDGICGSEISLIIG